MRIGTSHFVSLQKAIAYYSEYESDAARAVDRKLTAGEIHLGKPALKSGQTLVVIDGGARYAIDEIELKSPTRADYMDGKVDFATFYRAVNATAGLVITDNMLIARAVKALQNDDEHLNTIPLGSWDVRAAGIAPQLSRALKQHGDFYSMAGGVCCLKQATRDAVAALGQESSAGK